MQKPRVRTIPITDRRGLQSANVQGQVSTWGQAFLIALVPAPSQFNLTHQFIYTTNHNQTSLYESYASITTNHHQSHSSHLYPYSRLSPSLAFRVLLLFFPTVFFVFRCTFPLFSPRRASLLFLSLPLLHILPSFLFSLVFCFVSFLAFLSPWSYLVEVELLFDISSIKNFSPN